jgi:hypothetical protein
MIVGLSEGVTVGGMVGIGVRLVVGQCDHAGRLKLLDVSVGSADGAEETGVGVGSAMTLGKADGFELGSTVGTNVGFIDGEDDGSLVGMMELGLEVGTSDGDGDSCSHTKST